VPESPSLEEGPGVGDAKRPHKQRSQCVESRHWRANVRFGWKADISIAGYGSFLQSEFSTSRLTY
jgi:hypothetical protein